MQNLTQFNNIDDFSCEKRAKIIATRFFKSRSEIFQKSQRDFLKVAATLFFAIILSKFQYFSFSFFHRQNAFFI